MVQIMPFTKEEEKYFNDIAVQFDCKIIPWHTTTDGLPTVMIDMQRKTVNGTFGLHRIVVNYFDHREEYPLLMSLDDFYKKACIDMRNQLKSTADLKQ